jgi:hypothetical protein
LPYSLLFLQARKVPDWPEAFPHDRKNVKLQKLQGLVTRHESETVDFHPKAKSLTIPQKDISSPEKKKAKKLTLLRKDVYSPTNF